MIYNQEDMSTTNKSVICALKAADIWFIVGRLFALLAISALYAGVSFWLHPLKGKTELPAGLRWVKIEKAVRENALWIDAREPEVFEKEHVPESINVSMEHWVEGLETFVKAWDHKRGVVVYCNAGGCLTSIEVAERLKKAVPQAKIEVLEGGYPAWKKLQKK